MKVSAACESGQRGTVKLKLAKSQARKVGLKKATTLARKSVRCGASDKVTVTLKVSKKGKKALEKLRRGSLKATVTITMGTGTGTGADATSDRATLTLKGKK